MTDTGGDPSASPPLTTFLVRLAAALNSTDLPVDEIERRVEAVGACNGEPDVSASAFPTFVIVTAAAGHRARIESTPERPGAPSASTGSPRSSGSPRSARRSRSAPPRASGGCRRSTTHRRGSERSSRSSATPCCRSGCAWCCARPVTRSQPLRSAASSSGCSASSRATVPVASRCCCRSSPRSRPPSCARWRSAPGSPTRELGRSSRRSSCSSPAGRSPRPRSSSPPVRSCRVRVGSSRASSRSGCSRSGSSPGSASPGWGPTSSPAPARASGGGRRGSAPSCSPRRSPSPTRRRARPSRPCWS